MTVHARDYKWELYDLGRDYGQADNLAQKNPAKLAELRRDFDVAAEKNDVDPIRADVFGRMFAGKRPTIMTDPDSATYYPGPTRYTSGMFPNLPGHSWTATASIEVPPGGGDGTLVSQGGWPMGWGLFVIGGKPVFAYRSSDHDPEVRVTGDALSPGTHRIVARFAADPAPAAGGTATLVVDGKTAGSAPVARQWRFMPLSAAVGQEGDDTILPQHQPPFAYPGTIDQVRIDLVRPSKP